MEQPDNETVRNVLAEVFGSALQRTGSLIDKYATVYSLPHLQGEWRVDPEFFRHCERSVNFVVVALYNEKKEFFIINSQTKLSPTKAVGNKLPGGPIQDGRREFIEEAVHRIVRRETSLRIDELTPIACVTNTFRWNNHQIVHRGLAFMGKASGTAKMRTDAEVMLLGTGLDLQQPKEFASTAIEARFTSAMPEAMAFCNLDIVKLARQRLESKYLALPDAEVQASRRLRVRCGRVFHHFVVSKFMSLFASRPLRKKLWGYVGQPASILDASAGDDVFIYTVAKDRNPELCVANDISWLEMAPIRQKARRRHVEIMFTNHNVADLPFAKRFDVVLFKNTLHHARTSDEVVRFLEVLRKSAKRLMIVDIEDPARRVHAKAWNRYYTWLHGDQGHYFFSFEQFRRLIKAAYADATVTFDQMWTIRGLYMIGVVEFPG